MVTGARKCCAFCGGNDLLLVELNTKEKSLEHHVLCRSCRACGPTGSTPWAAESAWNQRHVTDSDRELSEEQCAEFFIALCPSHLRDKAESFAHKVLNNRVLMRLVTEGDVVIAEETRDEQLVFVSSKHYSGF